MRICAYRVLCQIWKLFPLRDVPNKGCAKLMMCEIESVRMMDKPINIIVYLKFEKPESSNFQRKQAQLGVLAAESDSRFFS